MALSASMVAWSTACTLAASPRGDANRSWIACRLNTPGFAHRPMQIPKRCLALAQRKQILGQPVMNMLSNLLALATADIDQEYFQLPIHGGGPVYRERVYCYELYHQMRRRWPDDGPF